MHDSQTDFRHELLKNVKCWLLLILTIVALALLLAITAAFVQAHRARTEAARYLRIVAPLRMGTAYNLVATQLRDAGLSTTCVDLPPEK